MILHDMIAPALDEDEPCNAFCSPPRHVDLCYSYDADVAQRSEPELCRRFQSGNPMVQVLAVALAPEAPPIDLVHTFDYARERYAGKVVTAFRVTWEWNRAMAHLAGLRGKGSL
jgi:hypothetical protein